MSDTDNLPDAINKLVKLRIKKAMLPINARMANVIDSLEAINDVIVDLDQRTAKLEADAPGRVKVKSMTVGDLLTEIGRLQLTPDMTTEIVSMEVSVDGLVVVKTAPVEPRKGEA